MKCPYCGNDCSYRAYQCSRCGEPFEKFHRQETYLKESLKRITTEAGQNYIMMGVRSENIYVQIQASNGLPYIYLEAVNNPLAIEKTKRMLDLGFKLPGDDIKEEELLVDDPSDYNFCRTFSIFPEESLQNAADTIFRVFYEIYEISPTIEFDFKVILEKISSPSPLESFNEF
jgi:hypothetical protein